MNASEELGAGDERHQKSAAVAAVREHVPLVLLIGTPITGKTTLFNRLTGQNARIGNYPGVTVERRSGSSRLDGNRQVEVVDLPGTYSLSARSAEEQIALWAVLGQGAYQRPDVCVFVADASQLSRNLYLALQLCELGLQSTCVVWRIAHEHTSRACNDAATFCFTSDAACSLSSSIAVSNTRPRCSRERTVPTGHSRTAAVSA